jgi:hypothetical protein
MNPLEYHHWRLYTIEFDQIDATFCCFLLFAESATCQALKFWCWCESEEVREK